MNIEALLRRLKDDTEDTTAVHTRVAARLAAERAKDEAAARLLSALPEPARGAEQRVVARLRSAVPMRTRPSPWWIGAPIVGGMVAAACVGAFFARFPVGVEALDAAPLDAPLASESVIQSFAPGNGVALSFQGRGGVGGTQAAPRVAWDQGSIDVEVPHGRGIDLRVETREAQVRVVGTGFTVTRSALGTRVTVRHGVVEVACTGGATTRIEAGQEQVCVPTGAAGLLARARQLDADGASASVVMSAIDAALSVGADGAVADEIYSFRAERRARGGDGVGALADARRTLANGGGARRTELLVLAATQALQVEGCAGAAPHLDALAAESTLDASLGAWRDACRADPDAAAGLATASR